MLECGMSLPRPCGSSGEVFRLHAIGLVTVHEDIIIQLVDVNGLAINGYHEGVDLTGLSPISTSELHMPCVFVGPWHLVVIFMSSDHYLHGT